jgi:hypothetical protein
MFHLFTLLHILINELFFFLASMHLLLNSILCNYLKVMRLFYCFSLRKLSRCGLKFFVFFFLLCWLIEFCFFFLKLSFAEDLFKKFVFVWFSNVI